MNLPQSEGEAAGRSAWRTPGWRVLLAMLLVIHLLPVWSISHFPSQDGPAHLYNAKVLLEVMDPANYQVRQFHVLNPALPPNVLAQVMLGALQRVAAPVVAEKLLLSLLVVLLPLSLLYLVDAVARGRAVLALVGFTVAYHQLLHLGFHGFSLSVSLCLFALGWWWRHHQRWSPGRLIWFYLLAAMTYLAHFAGFMALLLASTVAAGWFGLLRAGATAGRPTAAGATLAAAARQVRVLAMPLLPLALVGLQYHLRAQGDTAIASFRPLADQLSVFGSTLVLASYSDWHRWLTPPLLLATLLMLGLTLWRRQPPRLLERDALLLASLALAILYFILPWSSHGGGWVNDRVYLFAFLLAWAGFAAPPAHARWTLAALLVGISLAHVGRLAWDYRRFQPGLAELTAAVDRIAPHSTVAWDYAGGLGADAPADPLVRVDPWLHALSHYALHARDVVLFNNFQASQPHFTLAWGEASRRNPDYVVAWGHPDASRMLARHQARYQPIHQSPNLVLLKARTRAPELNRWARQADGSLALRLAMAAPGDGALRVGVRHDRLHSSGSYGWVRMSPRRHWLSADRKGFSGAVGDQRDRTFRIDLPNGRYHVTLHFPPATTGQHATQVIANDRVLAGAVALDATSGAGRLEHEIEVGDGQLTHVFHAGQRFPGSSLSGPGWMLSGIEVVARAPGPAPPARP